MDSLQKHENKKDSTTSSEEPEVRSYLTVFSGLVFCF